MGGAGFWHSLHLVVRVFTVAHTEQPHVTAAVRRGVSLGLGDEPAAVGPVGPTVYCATCCSIARNTRPSDWGSRIRRAAGASSSRAAAMWPLNCAVNKPKRMRDDAMKATSSGLVQDRAVDTSTCCTSTSVAASTALLAASTMPANGMTSTASNTDLSADSRCAGGSDADADVAARSRSNTGGAFAAGPVGAPASTGVSSAAGCGTDGAAAPPRALVGRSRIGGGAVPELRSEPTVGRAAGVANVGMAAG